MSETNRSAGTSSDVVLTLRRIPRQLAFCALALVACHLLIQLFHDFIAEVPWPIKDIFELDEEKNLPTWYSAGLLLGAAVLLFIVASARKRDGDRDAFFWKVLGFGFVAMSLDEVAGMRESLNTMLDETGLAPDVPFSLPEVVVVGLTGTAFLPFLLRLPARTRARFFVAGAVFLIGVMGLDWIAHLYLGAGRDRSMESLGYQFITAVEEACEMIGVILFIAALLELIRAGRPSARVTVELHR